jgi:putative MATE family efflux protein
MTTMAEDAPKAELAAEARRSDSRATATVRRITEGPLAWGIARFGFPLVVGMVLHTTFNLVDMFMIGKLPNGGVGLAALGICDMIAAVATILSNGVSTATVALISRRVGGHDAEGVARASWQSLLLVGALSVVFGLVGIFGHDVVIRGVMQAKGETADIASGYLQVILGGCFSIFFLLQITAILRARGHSKSAAALLVGGNLLNVLLNPFLIYGTGEYPAVFAFCAPLAEALHAPRLGVMGAAWATLFGRSVPVIIGALLLALDRDAPPFRLSHLRPDFAELRSLVRIGWPSSAQFVLRVSSILVFISLLTANYTTASDPSALTAYSVCLRLETMALFVGMGWGAAASTYVGVNLGAGLRERAKRAGLYAAGLNTVCMLGLTALYLRFAPQILGFFDADPAVLAAGEDYLWRVGLTYAVLGVGLVLSQAMTGAGATLPSLVLDLFGLLGVTVPLAYVVTELLGLPCAWLWNVIALGNCVSALAYVVYYLRGRFLDHELDRRARHRLDPQPA